MAMPKQKFLRRIRNSLACAGLSLALCCTAGSARACGIALALAVDVSGSVDASEYRLQMGGLASALRDATVSDALVKAEAAILLVQWSGLRRQEVNNRLDAGFRTTLISRRWPSRLMPHRAPGAIIPPGSERRWLLPPTPMPRCAIVRRKVIDVSGDGPSNEGLAPEVPARLTRGTRFHRQLRWRSRGLLRT